MTVKETFLLLIRLKTICFRFWAPSRKPEVEIKGCIYEYWFFLSVKKNLGLLCITYFCFFSMGILFLILCSSLKFSCDKTVLSSSLLIFGATTLCGCCFIIPLFLIQCKSNVLDICILCTPLQ